MMYLNAEGDFYNAGKETLCIKDLFKMKVQYGDGYAYEGSVVVEDGTDSFIKARVNNVLPFNPVYIALIVEWLPAFLRLWTETIWNRA